MFRKIYPGWEVERVEAGRIDRRLVYLRVALSGQHNTSHPSER